MAEIQLKPGVKLYVADQLLLDIAFDGLKANQKHLVDSVIQPTAEQPVLRQLPSKFSSSKTITKTSLILEALATPKTRGQINAATNIPSGTLGGYLLALKKSGQVILQGEVYSLNTKRASMKAGQLQMGRPKSKMQGVSKVGRILEALSTPKTHAQLSEEVKLPKGLLGGYLSNLKQSGKINLVDGVYSLNPENALIKKGNRFVSSRRGKPYRHLTAEQKSEILALKGTPGVSLIAIGKQFGCSPSVIWKLFGGKKYTKEKKSEGGFTEAEQASAFEEAVDEPVVEAEPMITEITTLNEETVMQ